MGKVSDLALSLLPANTPHNCTPFRNVGLNIGNLYEVNK